MSDINLSDNVARPRFTDTHIIVDSAYNTSSCSTIATIIDSTASRRIVVCIDEVVRLGIKPSRGVSIGISLRLC